MCIYLVLIYLCAFECIYLSHIMNLILCNCKSKTMNDYSRNMVEGIYEITLSPADLRFITFERLICFS